MEIQAPDPEIMDDGVTNAEPQTPSSLQSELEFDEGLKATGADASEYAPRKKQSSRKQGKTLLAMVVLFVMLVGVGGALAWWYLKPQSNGNDNSSSNKSLALGDEDEQDSVLTKDTIEVEVYEENEVAGTLTVEDVAVFNFRATVSEQEMRFSFATESLSAREHLSEWRGFEAVYSSDSVTLTLLRFENEESTVIVFTESQPPTAKENELLERLVESKLGQYMFELSLALADEQYIGPDNGAVRFVHLFAKWLYRMVTNDPNCDKDKWDAMDSTIAMVSEHVMDRQDHGEGSHVGRRRLGNCQIQNKCGNACFGRCGLDCSCWSWVCGDCTCWLGCKQHDQACSCDCAWYNPGACWTCANIFSAWWFACSGY